MNLFNAKINTPLEIVEIEKSSIKLRLLELGFISKEQIIVLKKSPLNKTVLVNIKNSVIAISSGTAENIKVKEL